METSEEVLAMLDSNEPIVRVYALEVFPRIVGPPTPEQAVKLAKVMICDSGDPPYIVACEIAGIVATLLARATQNAKEAALEISDFFAITLGSDQQLVEVGFWEPFESYASQEGIVLADIKAVQKKVRASVT